MSRTNSFLPSQLPFQQSIPIFIRLPPPKIQTLLRFCQILLNITYLKCPLNGVDAGPPSPRQRVPAQWLLGISAQESITFISHKLLEDDTHKMPNLCTMFNYIWTIMQDIFHSYPRRDLVYP